MKIVKGMVMQYRQPWMQEPQMFHTDITYQPGEEPETLTFELPNGSVVHLSYREVRAVVASVEASRLAE